MKFKKWLKIDIHVSDDLAIILKPIFYKIAEGNFHRT